MLRAGPESLTNDDRPRPTVPITVGMFRTSHAICLAAVVFAMPPVGQAAAPSPADQAFFETKIQPLLTDTESTYAAFSKI